MTERSSMLSILRDRKTVDIAPDPMTKKIYLNIPGPSLADNRADVDRLRHELAKLMGEVDISLELMNDISCVARESGWQATVTVGAANRGFSLVDIEAGDTTAGHYGLAVDIGTTTVVEYLVDMTSGRVIDVEAGYNGQVIYGEDILTRIFRAGEGWGLLLLRDAVLGTLNELVGRLVRRNGIPARAVSAVAVGANTTMAHLFLGLDPSLICVAPYIPVVNSPGILTAGSLGLSVNKMASVYILPGVGSYLGGDVIAGVLASGMHRSDELALLVDIGTNGEIIMGNSQWLVACAGAAGPALEGGVAACGMRAEPGAIYHVRINHITGELAYRTINGDDPVGICGSGLVDSMAQLFLAGLIDRSGRFRDGREKFVIVPAGQSGNGEDITITQSDINNLMRTKGAVNAALELLLESVGSDMAAIERFYAAGAFGHHLDIESAVTIGLYPDLPRERIVRLGNSSGEGARLTLMSRQCRQDAGEIAGNITYFELNANQEFMNKFVGSKFIPHTNIDYFPSVKRLLLERGLLRE